MLISKSNPLFSLISLFLCSFLRSSSATSRLHHHLTVTTLRVSDVDFGSVEEPWETRRYLAEEGSSGNASLILAAERTHRSDPLDGFKKYTGGWNITDRHYWASVGYTAAPLFAIAVAWFVIFGLTLSFICLCYCCCRKDPFGYSRPTHAISLVFLVVSILAATLGGLVLHTGEKKFDRSTTKTIDYVVDQSIATSGKLRNVSVYLDSAKHIGVGSVAMPEDMPSQIDSINTKINSVADTISNQTSSTSQNARNLFNEVRVSLNVLSVVMLVLVFVGFLSSVLGLQFLVYCLVIIGWILVTGTFILSGIFLLLHNAVADTCVAMDEWIQNSTARTALDEILPCVDNATAEEILGETKDVTYRLISLVNNVINNVTNKDVPPEAGQGYFNQSGPLMPTLCNPFNDDEQHSARQCEDGEAKLSDAAEVWEKYVCKASSSGICTTPGRMTPAIYAEMKDAANVSYGLSNEGPALVDVVDCTFVRETFTNIRSAHCPGLRRHSKWIYVGLATEGGAVLLSLIFWVLYVREFRRRRGFTKQFLTH